MEYFDADNDAPVVLKLTNEEIAKLALNLDCENDSEDDEAVVQVASEKKVSIDRCIELTKELIRGMKQKNFVSESQIMAVYKIQELFLREKPNRLKQTTLDGLFKNL